MHKHGLQWQSTHFGLSRSIKFSILQILDSSRLFRTRYLISNFSNSAMSCTDFLGSPSSDAFFGGRGPFFSGQYSSGSVGQGHLLDMTTETDLLDSWLSWSNFCARFFATVWRSCLFFATVATTSRFFVACFASRLFDTCPFPNR